MTQHSFSLKKDQEYIPLNKLLQLLQLSQTGGHAKLMIQNEEVMVNGAIETRVRKKLYKKDEVQVDEHFIKIE